MSDRRESGASLVRRANPAPAEWAAGSACTEGAACTAGARLAPVWCGGRILGRLNGQSRQCLHGRRGMYGRRESGASLVRKR